MGAQVFQRNIFQNNVFQVGTVTTSRGVSDTTDPVFYDWWRKKAAEQHTKGKRRKREREDVTEPIGTVTEPQRPRKPALLSAATLAGLEQAQSLDDIARLSAALRGAEAALMRELMLAYERERDEEEAIELLLLA